MSDSPDLEYAPLRPWMWGAAVGLLGLAFVFDGAIISCVGPARDRLTDFHMTLRVAGTVPAWIIVFLAVAAATAKSCEGARIRTEFLLAIFTGALAAGFAALLKPLVRRPDLARQGPYEGWCWEPFGAEPWDASDLCFPSGHAAVAWGVCLTLSRLRPPLAWVLMPLAFGAAAARVASRGHHPSDVAGSLIVAMFASCLVSRLRVGVRRAYGVWRTRRA